jgi:hypothetical protein
MVHLEKNAQLARGYATCRNAALVLPDSGYYNSRVVLCVKGVLVASLLVVGNRKYYEALRMLAVVDREFASTAQYYHHEVD